MFLREIERHKIAEAIVAASAQLHYVPKDYTGPCDLFRAPQRGDGPPTEMPVCAGKCKRGETCHLAIVAWEGSHSDLYYVAVFCTCMSPRELDDWVRSKNGEVIRP